MTRNAVCGWDIGGAHVKAVCVDDCGRVFYTRQIACQLWRELPNLDTAVDGILTDIDVEITCHAVTMTGELVDAFPNRKDGVYQLVQAIARHVSAGSVLVYAGRGGFLGPDVAVAQADDVASANWLASGTWLASMQQDGIFIDVGSTTTDIVPCRGGRVRCKGFNDHERLAAGELLYTGVVRTPVLALAGGVPVQGRWVSLMAEVFATTADVYRLLDELPEHADLQTTSDGNSKSRRASARRLARMLGCDLVSADLDSWVRVARYLRFRQLTGIREAYELVVSSAHLSDDAPIVGAGIGRFLIRDLATQIGRPYKDFGFYIEGDVGVTDDNGVADVAPAYAVAKLAQIHRHHAVAG